MPSPEITGLDISPITHDVFLVRQKSPRGPLSCCSGLMVAAKQGRNKNPVAIDVNVEPEYVGALAEAFGAVKEYICTFGEMNHIAHLHAWEAAGAAINAPRPEASHCTDLKLYSKGFGYGKGMRFSAVKKFAGENGYRPCKKTKPYRPGTIFRFDNLVVGTVPLKGHSPAHVAAMLVNERVLFMESVIAVDGLGAHHRGALSCGRPYCSLPRLVRDLELIRTVFLEHADLFVCEGGVFSRPDTAVVDLMIKAIHDDNALVREALRSLNPLPKTEKKRIKALLDRGVFLPEGAGGDIENRLHVFRAGWAIRHHLRERMVPSP